MTRSQRGLTLLEVVLAISLVTTIGAALLPVLVRARKTLTPPPPSLDAYELSRLADAVRQDPKTDVPSGVTVERIEGTGSAPSWLVLRSGDAVRLRVLRASNEGPR